MARKRKARGRPKSVSVRGHSRSPRGPDAGKPRPSVRRYRRSKPRKRR
jgi:hypothetical protein